GWLCRRAIIFDPTCFCGLFLSISRRFADSPMKCPSLHLWVPLVILQERTTMNPVQLTPQQRFRLRRQLRTTDDLGTYRRTLGLLELDRGNTVTDVALRLGVSRRTVHGWIDTYRHHPVPSSLVTHHGNGRPSDWTEDAQAILRAS